MSFPDARRLSEDQRAQAAWRAHEAYDIDLPDLEYFNSSPCRKHEELTRGCQRCGVRLRRHQRTGATWMYFAGKGLLADTVGSGKTAQVAAVLALCKASGELSFSSRCVVICKAAAVEQWGEQLRRFLPQVIVLTSAGTPGQRRTGYLSNWEVCVVSDRSFAPARGGQNSRDGDVEILRQCDVGIVFYDDIDAMRTHKTATAYAVKRLARSADRVHGVHGTPLQKRLMELHSFLEPVGGAEVLGTQSRVKQRYITRAKQYLWTADKNDPTGRRKVRRSFWVDTGIKEEALPEFKRLIAPLILRRTAADLDDVDLPAVETNEVWFDLSAQQKARYDELKRGTLRILNEAGEPSTSQAKAVFTRGAQICSGLASLDGVSNDVSVKLDWVVDKVTGDMAEDKVIVFVGFKPNVEALSGRLSRAGVKHVLFWSNETNAQERERRRLAFLNDPETRVLIGTTTIEQSLNLQAARHLIAVDTIPNPARMEQLVGRARRQGSAHTMILFHHLLTRGTQEVVYPETLRAEQSMADSVWGEGTSVFSSLTPRQVMNMVARGTLNGT